MGASTIQTLTNAMVAGGAILLREAGRLFRAWGLTAAQFNALNLLADAPEGLRPSELTESLVVDASSTTYVLDQMEKRRWIRRIRDLEDRRAYRVVITPIGKKLYAAVAPHYEAALAEIAARLQAPQLERTTDILKQIQHLAPAAVDQVLNKQAAPRLPARRSLHKLPARSTPTVP